MAGFIPAIYDLRCGLKKSWMPGTSPGMTMKHNSLWPRKKRRSFLRRFSFSAKALA
jgi:hypothetical protein